ncbi:MAG: hypothetical protein II610_00590 [Treponema sp.]|nr:hypothetical protein [Treponema sp.]
MIPQLLLEEILLGEKDAKNYYSKYGKEELESALDGLRKSNQEILSAYPASRFAELASAALDSSKQTGRRAPTKDAANIVRMGKKPKNFYTTINRIAFSAAAVLALAFFAPILANSIKGIGGAAATRLKGSGHHQIRLYRQDGQQAVQLKNGDSAKENDLVQITYTPGSYNYGVIFSVDGNGNITRHFPDASWQAQKLEKTGEEVPLSFAYELDDAPKYECFIFVASKSPFDFSSIESLDKNKLSVDFLKQGSYLPKDCDGAIFTLNKK